VSNNKSKNLKGIVVALKANFLIVEIDFQCFKTGSSDKFSGKSRLLCTRRNKLDYQGLFIDVGDIVFVECIDYKNKKAVIPFSERIEIVSACRYVDLAVPQTSMNKIDAHKRYKFHKMFVGDDWYKTDKWDEYEKQLKALNVEIIYFTYTKNTSSTLINNTLKKLRKS